jgi:putative IMPACT (imprinted ancient) family translation regulator
MLDILISHELYNLVVVVTRYFGGTLLGTGGLVKAYQGAVLEGLKSSRMITKELGNRITLTTDYNLIGKIQYLISQENITLLNSEYTDIVSLTLLVQPDKTAYITKKIAELTNGSAILEFSGQVYFTNSDGEVILF